MLRNAFDDLATHTDQLNIIKAIGATPNYQILPTGAATSALQNAAITAITNAIAATPNYTILPTGAATAALQIADTNAVVSALSGATPSYLAYAVNNPTGKRLIGNIRETFNDKIAVQGGSSFPDNTIWNTSNSDNTNLIIQGGNSFGSSYIRISLDPFLDSTEVTITSKQAFIMPGRAQFALSISQRTIGQEFFVGMVGATDGTNIDAISLPSDLTVSSNSCVIATTNVAPFNVNNHGLNSGDRVIVFGCAEPRLNVDPVVVTVIDKDNFSVPVTLAAATYNCTGGTIRNADPLRGATNAVGLLYENATTTNASFVTRRMGAKFRSINSGTTTSASGQGTASPFADALTAGGINEISLSSDETSYRCIPLDSVGAVTGPGRSTTNVPDDAIPYKLMMRTRTLKGFTRPIARVTAISKTGTTTASVTTDVAHGLASTDWVQIYGVRDQVNFPNLSTAVQVSSIVDSTHFTVVIAGAVTANSQDGAVWIVQGGITAPGITGQIPTALVCNSKVITLTGLTAAPGFLVGDYVNIYGLVSTLSAYEGAYRVLRLGTTSIDLEAPNAADITSTTTGGAIFRRSDLRIHFVKVLDHNRTLVEITGGRGNVSDGNNAVPVTIASSANFTSSVQQSTGSSNTAIWEVGGHGGFLVNDVVSAAVTTTTTSGTITPGIIANVGTMSHTFTVIVTANSGTNQTMDVGVEESPDNGTTWYRIYDFERITTTNATYTSPQIRARFGTRFRYVRTINGTTPSFTHSINRTMFSHQGQVIHRYIDRSITLTSLNSVTPTYLVEGCDYFEVIVNVGAITTTAPTLMLEFSETGIAGDWTLTGATPTFITASANNTVRQVFSGYGLPKFMRVRVASPGSGVTAGYIAIKALGR